MAILKKISVAIVVNGQELREYDDEDAGKDDQNSLSKYVEATSGAEFQIVTSARTRFESSTDVVLMEISLDGVCEVNSLVLKEDAWWWTGAWQRTVDGVRRFDGKGWVAKPFKFVEITTLENDCRGTDNTIRSSHIKDLGMINVKFCRQKLLGKDTARIWDDDKNTGGASVLTEKQLKGKSVTHGVAFGDVRKTTEVAYYRTADVEGDNSPIAEFTFKYCSRKALQDLLLIPRALSPPREPSLLPLEERNIEDLTPEEIRELLRRQQARYRMERDTIKNVTSNEREKTEAERGTKREHDDEYDELIRSAITKKAKTRPFEHGETIELD